MKRKRETGREGNRGTERNKQTGKQVNYIKAVLKRY